jgi:hypothetical protein
MKINTQKQDHWFLWVPRILSIVLIIYITAYTYDLFSDTTVVTNGVELLFYMLPSLIIIMILTLGWRHEHITGMLILFISGVFLLIYHVFISIGVFITLLFIGTLFLVDESKIKQKFHI